MRLLTVATATLLALAALLTAPAAAQLQDTGQVNTAYDRTDPDLAVWAAEVVASDRGPIDHQDPDAPPASFGEPGDMLGPDGTAVSLGDHGTLTIRLAGPVTDGPGDDLVVFENGFDVGGLVYAELAFVEVSSDGAVFARLPAFCRRTEPTGTWDVVDPADYYNLAGNLVGGTGLDLQDLVLAGHPDVLSGAVDLGAIEYVRLVDVIGDLGPGGTVDHLGRPVSDPYPTATESGGFDATGVAALHPQPVAVAARTLSAVKRLFR
jgi:hypothetical protein